MLVSLFLGIGGLSLGIYLQNKFCPDNEHEHNNDPIIEEKEKFNFLNWKSKKKNKNFIEKKRPSYYH